MRFVYGADIVNDGAFKDDAADILYEMMMEKEKSCLREMFADCIEENRETFDDGKHAFEQFLLEYENDIQLWGGYCGFIADLINERECSYKTIFENDYCAIFMEPYIPTNAEDKQFMPTIEDIDRIRELLGY